METRKGVNKLPFVPVPNCAELVLQYRSNLQDVRTVLNFAHTTSEDWDETELARLIDDAYTAWTDNLKGIFPSPITIVGLTARNLNSETGPAIEMPIIPAVPGTSPGTPVPDNVAFALRKVTGRTGRSYRGRIFHFGMPTVALSDPGHLLDAAVTDIQAAYNNFFVDMASMEAGRQHVVVSRYSGMENVIVDGRYTRRPIPRASGIFTDVVSISSKDNVLDSQRRRLPGRGV